MSCLLPAALLGLLCLSLPVSAQEASGGEPEMRLMRVTSLPHAIQMHGSAVVGNRIYVLGGNVVANSARRDGVTNGWSNRTFSAPILADGRLGEWRTERPLPDRRAYISNSTEVVDNRIYIVAGTVAPTADAPEAQALPTRTALWTAVNSDGTLSEWKTTSQFPGLPVAGAATCSSGRALYLLGGSTSPQGVTSQIIIGRLDSNGSVARWDNAGTLPQSLWFHGCSLQDSRLFVWGGLSTRQNEKLNTKVWSAPIESDDSLGTWREEAEIENPVYSSAFEGFNEYLFSIAGRYRHGHPTGSIWFTRLNSGRVERWQLLRTDLEARLYAAVGVDEVRGNIYVTGGRFRPGLDPSVGRVLDIVQAFHVDQPTDKQLPSLQEVAGMPATNQEPKISELGQMPKLNEALASAKSAGKSVLVIFYSPEVPGVRRLRDSILARPEFKTLASPYILSSADVSGPDTELTHTYGVYQVPTLLMITPDGEVRKRLSRPQTIEEVQEFLQSSN